MTESMRVKRARPIRDRLITVIMWENHLSSCRNRLFRRRNPEEGFRCLFSIKEILLAMETVPELGTDPIPSLSVAGSRGLASWFWISFCCTSTSGFYFFSTPLFLPRSYYRGWRIVPTLRCVYALSTLIMNASVSFTARVLTRRAQVHGHSTLHGADASFSEDRCSWDDYMLAIGHYWKLKILSFDKTRWLQHE